jgi:dTDP-glucose 4,6-dehydratase
MKESGSDSKTFSPKTILVTGGAGFIGSRFVLFMLQNHPDRRIVTLDNLTYAGSRQNLAAAMADPRHLFVQGDICDAAAVETVFAAHRPDAVVHFAAETHVDRAIDDPAVFVRTNVLGTQVLLDACRKWWLDGTGETGTVGAVRPVRPVRPTVATGGSSPGLRCNRKFIQISTDEVYGSLGAQGAFTEASPLAPNNPYAASKAAADLLVRAYANTYGLVTNITRCSNNYGPNQHPEKLIPLMIQRAMADRPLPVYGDGLQVRDWLYVDDHCRAIDLVLRNGMPGEVYNIGGGTELTNLALVRQLLALLHKPESLIAHVPDRPGHDRRYAMDATKLREALGWEPTVDMAEGLRRTVTHALSW